MAEDYEECLHHTKEKKRMLQINEQLDKKKAENPEFTVAEKKAFDVNQLGLINDPPS